MKPQRKVSRKIGLSPGAVIFTGKRKVDHVAIHYCQYDDANHFNEEYSNQSLKALHKPDADKVQWYDFRGLHDVELIGEVGVVFGVHPLVLEDITDVNQRPKFDEYDTGCFLKLDSLTWDMANKQVKKESVSIYLGEHFVLSFQEDAEDLFHFVRTRLSSDTGRIRKRNADYLLYALVDIIVDHYFLLLDDMQTEVENLEEIISTNAAENTKLDILHIKKEYLMVKKSLLPLREALSKLSKSDHQYIEDKTQLFIRDVYDHTIQIADMVETNRDTLSGLQDLYISEVSFRMNKVMQLLTIVTTIFVPLTFLAGIYGMNFEYIPELKWHYGYFGLMGLMTLISVLLVFYFKRKRWL